MCCTLILFILFLPTNFWGTPSEVLGRSKTLTTNLYIDRCTEPCLCLEPQNCCRPTCAQICKSVQLKPSWLNSTSLSWGGSWPARHFAHLLLTPQGLLSGLESQSALQNFKQISNSCNLALFWISVYHISLLEESGFSGKMKSTEVQTLGVLRMRGTANRWAGLWLWVYSWSPR